MGGSKMRRSIIFFGLLASVGFLVAQAATSTVVARTGGEYGKPEVVLRDDCDPTDPGWAPTGGCKREEGAVRLAEFNALRLSRRQSSVIRRGGSIRAIYRWKRASESRFAMTADVPIRSPRWRTSEA